MPPAKPGKKAGLTIAFAGNVCFESLLHSLALALKRFGGTLVIYGPPSESVSRLQKHANVVFRGHAERIIETLRSEADCLYVPMSFSSKDRVVAQTCFPSKIVDYTAAGVPLLIQGPDYCAPIRWANENPGVAEAVTDDGPQALMAAIRRLTENPEYGASLARRALDVGQAVFSHQTALEKFYGALTTHPQADTMD